MPRLPRLLALLALALAAVAISACGAEHDSEARQVRADTEGLYLELGGLQYQVQSSRQLNPADETDRAFFVGIPQDARDLEAGQTWFAVFLLVQNNSDEAQPAAEAFEIIDTQERVYRPVPLGRENVYRYRAFTIPPGGTLPESDTTARESAIGGALLMFKITNQSLDNRPLEFKIETPEVPQETGIIDLDV